MRNLQNKEAREKISKLETNEEINEYFNEQAKFVAARINFQRIDNFNGAYDFLNNEYPSLVYFEGSIYPSAFNAFQASRTNKSYFRNQLQKYLEPEDLYQLCIQISNPVNWGAIRDRMMRKIIRR